MNRLSKTALILLLVAGIAAPSSMSQAKTYEDVPTVESSILSRTADPTKASQELLAQEEIESSDEKTEETSDKKIEDSTQESETKDSSEEESSTKETRESTTDHSTETTDSSKEKEKKKSPRATFLREGNLGDNPDSYDIDRQLSTLLRYGGTSVHTNSTFTGRGKTAGTLTDEDMKSLTIFTNIASQSPTYLRALDVKGLEYATNLEELTLQDYTSATDNANVTFGDNGKLDLGKNIELKKLTLYLKHNLKDLDTSKNDKVEMFNIMDATDLDHIDFSNMSKLERVSVIRLNVTKLDFTKNPMLYTIHIHSVPIKDLDLSGNPELGSQGGTLLSNFTKLSKVPDFTNNTKLVGAQLRSNYISDIRPIMLMDNAIRSGVLVSTQEIMVPIPYVDENKKATLDLLRTTNQRGLNVSNVNITGSPVLTPNGDKIELSNVTRASLNGRTLSFSYNNADLAETIATSGTNFFNGKITFYIASSIKNELKASEKKFASGDTVDWTWDIESVSEETAKNVCPTLNLPTGLSLVPGSVEIDGVSVSDSAIDGSTSLGDLAQNQGKTITFKTQATGTAETWFEASGKLDWEDTSKESPFESISKESVQIKDEEQTHTPEPTKEMGILSVPIRFDYGLKDISKTDQSYSLSPDLYQTNTNVVSNGFYTRVKDDRDSGSSTGWSLSARLSNFVDVNNPAVGMPDSYGTALQLDDMSIEAIKDRDTANEAIDPSPSGTPSIVASSETIVAGESAKTLVSAQAQEGLGTWQLRIPFDKVSLKIPAHAGKENSNYRAKLTWSLDDVPA